MKSKNLLNLEKQDFNEFIDSIDNFVLDLDGVVWDFQSNPINGVTETIEKLQQLKKKIYFVTNNTLKSIQYLHDKLSKFIPDVSLENIINPTAAIIWYLKSINFDKEVFLISGIKMKEAFVESGFKLVSSGPNIVKENTSEWINDLRDNTNIGAAVFDMDMNTNFYKLSKFLNCINNKNVLFITGISEKKNIFRNHLLFGSGIYHTSLSNISNRTPLSFGKPNKGMQDYVIQKFNISDLSRTLFVGDMLISDIVFGKKCGFKTLLVLTGVAKLEDLENCTKEETPDYYISSLGNLFY